MEVAIPFKNEFDFNSARSSPFTSPPSTPKPFNGDQFYFSAPSSPSHISQFYREFDNLFISNDDDFAFDVSQELGKSSVPAEELFDGGMIKPLTENRASSPVLEKNRVPEISTEKNRESRGKQRILSSSKSRTARSLSPIRKNQYENEDEEEEEEEEEEEKPCSILCSSSSSKGSKKWRFKDLFLFRSASEGRASDKDPLKKYTAACSKNSSLKGNDQSSISSSSKSMVKTRRKNGKISAHELHYTINRAVSSDLKKKTFLPYKQGILGQLAFNPAVHALANGFGLSRR